TGQVFTIQKGASGGTRNLLIDHNTITAAYTDVLVSGVHSNFQFTNNVMPQGTYGMIVDALGVGPAALANAFPDGVIRGNVIVSGSAALYPAGNFLPKTWDQVAQYPGTGARSSDPGTVNGLSISGIPSSVTVGTAASFNVTAKDGVGNIFAGYKGTIHFSST